ncbi:MULTISPECIES: hypothetical protein [unclassified Nocardioides]|uniref:hypothetical protein n=1 Tax=unclassified Nocardioides TaxID=2615069 RepID=UPI000703A67B|nr:MULTISPECIES: hypothetical protein [unclassified Nocardioides]KRC48891.1 hypothetical protein ASE19_18430 [Nocardioides sp. Root79]KRC75290.1 hypothetical protein ASE20_20330 [Nocardioides sp. Root240]
MSLLAVSDAAVRLGISTRQVQHLVARGDLRSLARGVVDETSVERLLAVRRGSHTRAWAESTAWAAVALLSGLDAGWLGESQRSRLRGRLRGLGAEELIERARGRASVSRYVAHRSAGERLRSELVDTASAAERLGLAATNVIDGYLAATAAKAVVSRHSLIRDDTGIVTLRATSMDLDVLRELVSASDVLAALDLAESLDVRERRAGVDALGRALDVFRA